MISHRQDMCAGPQHHGGNGTITHHKWGKGKQNRTLDNKITVREKSDL